MRIRPGRGMKWIGKSSMRAAVWIMLIGMGVVFGRGIGGNSNAATEEVQSIEWGEWKGYGKDFVRVGGERVRVGETVNGATLVAFDRDERVAVFDRGGIIWMWEYRTSEPTRVGETSEVAEFARGRLASDRSSRRGSVEPDSDTTTRTMDNGPGDADGG